MDRTDYQILNILQENSRRTLRCIGTSVSLTPPAVADRIHRMEDAEIIRCYSADVDRSKLGYNVTGFIFAAVDSQKYNSFCALCEKEDAIICFHHVVGIFNALLRFAVHNTNELDELLSSIKSFGDSRTSIELQTVFDKKAFPLDID